MKNTGWGTAERALRRVALAGAAGLAIGAAGADAAHTAPDLVVRRAANPPAAQAPGTSFRALATVMNRGTREARRSHVGWFLSADAALGRSAVRLGARPVRPMAPRANGSVSARLTIPDTVLPGRYHLLACADAGKAVAESNEANNCASAGRRVTIVGADLVVTVLSEPPASLPRGASLTATDTVANRGLGPAAASVAGYYLSVDAIKDNGDARLGGRPVDALARNGQSTDSAALAIPGEATPGAYFVLACADDEATVAETREADNCRVATTKLSVVDPPAPPPEAQPAWAPAATAPIHPGVQTYSSVAFGQCTSNFVFTDRSHDVYIGQAAHCTSLGDGTTNINGCTTGSLPLGESVSVDGASEPGTMVYNSWLAMQAANEKNTETCVYNDFALIRLEPTDAAKVNPSLPGWGGPVGMASFQGVGNTVYSFGNSGLRGGERHLSPKQGVEISRTTGGWSTTVYTVTPGIPGDSGSAFLDASGNAAGVLSTWNIYTGWNGIGDLPRELAYAQQHSGLLDLVLAKGTEPFDPDLVHAITSTP